MRSLSKAERVLTLLAVTVVALTLLLSSVAQAEPPKLVPYGSFASDGNGVAVDQSSQHVFTAGFYEVNKRYEFVSYGHLKQFAAEGKLISTFGPEGVYAGAAVNPVNGNLYVLEALSFETFAPRMAIYKPGTGEFVRAFPVASARNVFGFYSILQIAADSSGNVYVPGENDVLEYSEAGTLLNTFTGSGASALNGPTGVATDASGDVWVADSGNNRIQEFDPSGTAVSEHEIKSEGVSSLALDGHGDLFALVFNNADPCGEVRSSRCFHLVEYGAEGRQLADVGAGDFGSTVGGSPLFSMVAVDEASGRVYVTDDLKNTVWMFAPPTMPAVDREFTAEINASEAKLGALVKPGGIAASYHFEYGTTSAYGHTTPFPDGSAGEGFTARAVWASAKGLAPGNFYHYRIVASNELGTAYGPDQTFTTLTPEQAACPNEQVRTDFSARLPDCRAYELVTPPVKNSSQFDAQKGFAYSSMAAADGEAVTLRVQEPRPGAPSAGEYYVATRGAGSWIAEDVMPIESYHSITCMEWQQPYAYSEQLTQELLQVGGASRASASKNEENPESCNPEGNQVVNGEPVGYENLLVRDNASGTYQLVNAPPPGVTPADAHFKGASADLSHVIFTETSPLAEGAKYGVENLYEWDEGVLRLTSVLPDGTPVAGSFTGGVASDGSHVLFTYSGALYDRIDGQRTVQIDEKQGGSGASGGGSFVAATSDGSKVFFLDCNRLTEDSTAVSAQGCHDIYNQPTGNDLYEYDFAKPAGQRLTDLSVDHESSDALGADVQRVTPLGHHDSSNVYFTAKGVLASNTREFTNSEGQTVVEGAQAGKENLYLWNGKDTTFIATSLYGGEFGVGSVSPDGKWLSFPSRKSLTGYDNIESTGEYAGEAAEELFLYSATTGQLVCVSCNPTGEAPVGSEWVSEGVAGGGREQVPAGGVHSGHGVTDAGQAFFDTRDPLVPSDTNGQLDVYEYERGEAHLISSGTSPFESNLEDASESGNDVFFRSSQALVPQDTQDGQIVIYDARVAGGFPATVSPPACTTADACRTPAPLQPSIYGAPASQTFSGVGNLAAPVGKAVKQRSLTREQKLRRALMACHKKGNKRKRSACERQAKRRYGAKASRFKRSGKANASKRGGK